jgi:hypothetical protein
MRCRRFLIDGIIGGLAAASWKVMVSIRTKARKVIIVGHGLFIPERFELSPGIFVESNVPSLNIDEAASGSRHFQDYAAALTGGDLATFCIEVQNEEGGRRLAGKAWNALRLFHLLSLACTSPCFSLYSISLGEKNLYSAANQNLLIRALPEVATATLEQLSWAKKHIQPFNNLVSSPEFSSAMRCYGNSHYLFDLDTRIMLLWAGIEALLSVDGELNRRLALYAAMMLEGTGDEKIAFFNEVKKAYAIRSRAVNGGRADATKLQERYQTTSRILSRLLARCVELGRVPSPLELDNLAVSQTVR